MKMSLEAWQREWGALRGAAALEDLARRWGLSRCEMLAQAPALWVTAVDEAWLEALLWRAAQDGVRLQVSRCVDDVETPALLSGCIDAVVGDVGGLWLRGGARALGLSRASLAQIFWVRLPSARGLTEWIESFDAAGQLMWRLGSAAPAAGPQRCEWRRLLAALADEVGDRAVRAPSRLAGRAWATTWPGVSVGYREGGLHHV